ncbi:NAD-dependent epimerase/dehydratase family protein [Draconibacterium orientale]|uniref:NAD-dependent epimerase/dehydratase family protein n=1 Tax=Draconibacterium orientale TaxID=1168034 RepID=UPI0029BFBD0C|nr:NAD-dependent epimerase/dehydratase family protein [Draconibacterium orientale]
MHKKVAIIGGNGFIGSNLSKYLLDKNMKVKVLDKFINKDKISKTKNSNVKFIESDITNTAELINNIGDFENIIWLVHTSVPSNSMLDLTGDLLANLDPLVKFLMKIKDTPNIERFIFLSSGGTIYGNPQSPTPINEDHPINPISNYGITKYTQEKYINLLLNQSQIQTFILRPSNVYGPYQNLNKPQGIVGHAFKAATNNHPINLFDNGQIIRDFIFVDDLSDAIFQCLNSSSYNASVESYNIGSEIGISIKEIINHIETVSEQNIKLIFKPARPFDCNYNVLDCSKFKSNYCWEARTTAEKGIKTVHDWILSTNR